MEVLIILVLILLNGFFALSEIALVSSKSSTLEQMRAKGRRGAREALALQANSENFLSAVQVGITLIGIVTGVYGGVRIADNIAPFFSRITLIAPYAVEIALVLTVIVITYVSIVIGELVPKTIALSNPERIAVLVAPVVRVFSKLFYPFVWLLAASTSLVNRILGIRRKGTHVTEAELRHMIRIATREGVIQKEQNLLHEKVFYFYDKKAKHVMTHRRDVEWIDLDESEEAILRDILSTKHSKLIAAHGSLDQFEGVLDVREFLIQREQDSGVKAAEVVKEPVIVPETMDAQGILNLFRDKQLYLAVVVSEFGSFEGMITLHDLVENIIGDIPEEGEITSPEVFIREDLSALVNGNAPVEVLTDILEGFSIDFEKIDYSTVAGFVLASLNKVPQTGDVFYFHDAYRIEIIDMDGTHIDKILISRQEAPEEE